MVQVDVFWSFAIGAGFAAAAGRQIQQRAKEGEYKMLEDPHFTKTIIYLACLFAPSGIYLVWQFTGWETMYFWTGPVKTGLYKYERVLPAWLVTLFAITNVTQGILGYWWASVYIRRNELFKASMLWIAGYFFMFFILVHGWDGYGYVRFFTRNLAEWDQMFDPVTKTVTHPFGPWMALKWAFTAPVAWTLYAMGVVMLPLLFYWISDWLKKGYELSQEVDKDRAARVTRWDLVKVVLRIVFVHTLAAAILTSLCIRLVTWIFGTAAGWILGFGLGLVLSYFIWLREEQGLIRREISRLTLETRSA